MLYAENEDVLGCEALVSDVLAGLSAKQPKLVAGSVATLTELVRAFGPKQVTPKPIMKRLPDIFGHADKNVRAEGSQLAQELHRYLGAALRPTIESLKEIQAKELQAQFDEIDRLESAKPNPTRHLVSQRAAAQAAAAAKSVSSSDKGVSGQEGGTSNAVNGHDEADFDAYEMAEAVDPLRAKAWPNNFDEQVRSPKWSERKEILDAAKAVLTSHIKLQNTPAFDFFVDTCVERIKKDATVHVWLTACQCLEAAATGMRSSFAKYRERTLPPLLEKLKERKQSTADIVGATLDAVFQTTTFGDILEDVLLATKHKNPNVKTETIRFLARCLRTTKTAPAKADLKPIADSLLAACSDGSGDVRDAGTQGLGTLMKLVGERPLNPYLDQLDEIKKVKVREEFAKAIVSVKSSVAPAKTPSMPAPAVMSVPRGNSSAATAAAKPKTVARPVAAGMQSSPMSAAPKASGEVKSHAVRPPVKSGPATASSGRVGIAKSQSTPTERSKAAATSAISLSEPVKFRFTPEEAEARIQDLLPGEISAQLANSNWKERLAGIQAFSAWLSVEVETVEAELIVRALAKKPGWKESNFQVMGEAFRLLQMLAQQCPTFSRPSVALSTHPLCDKLGDIKLKGPAGDTLAAYAERTSFPFVLKQSLGPLASLKAPKAIADSLLWIDSALLDFGVQGVEVKGLVEHLLSCLKSANAAVRNNATTVMGTLSRFLGPSLNTFLGDLNPQLRSTIEGEIQKATGNPPPEPTRFSGEMQASVTSNREAGNANPPSIKDAAAEEDALEALIPREDIDRLLPSSAVVGMGDANWKVRKESLEEIQSILQSKTRLKGTLADLNSPLKLRFADSNIMCKILALDIAARLANGLGKHFEPQTRNFVAPVTQCLADAKPTVRQAAATTLSAIADAVGEASMITSFAAVLETKAANPQLRGDLFTWLAARFELHPPDKSCDLAPIALGAVQCLDDKLAAVKKAALAALPYIIQRAGYKFVVSQSDSMKAASRSTVLPLIEQARATANALRAPAGGATATQGVASTDAASNLRPGLASRPTSIKQAPPSSATPPRTGAGLRTAGSIRPPSAATRSISTPSASRASGVAASIASPAIAKPAFASRLGVAKKAVLSSTSSAASNRTVSSSAGESRAPFLTSDPKYKLGREKREARGGANWISAEGTPRAELLDKLRSQCDHHLSLDILEQMFSRDHNAERDYLSALTLLIDVISSPVIMEEENGVPREEAIQRIVSSSDLVLKYIAIRLTENNTSLSLKCFDVLNHLVDLLRQEQYHVSDYEANSILPCMIAKFGDAKVAFRDRLREIFRKLTLIYPPSKLMSQYVEHGLPSKNARTRAECLGEIGFLFSKHGMQVCTPSKTLPVIAKSISDRDTNVRTAALLAVGECYKMIGEDVWALVGRLPDKEMSLLEERLKRTTVSKPVAPTHNKASAGSNAAQSNVRSMPSHETKTLSSKTRLLPPTARGVRASEAGLPGSPSTRPALRAPSQVQRPAAALSAPSRDEQAVDDEPEGLPGNDHAEGEQKGSQSEEDEFGGPDIEQTIHEVLSSESERSTEALKAIHQEMQRNASIFASFADQLASVLAKQFNRAFARLSKEASNSGVARLRKYLIQVGSSLFDAKMRSSEGRTLASYVEQSSLGALMTQLLQRLIDTSNQAKEDDEAKMYATYLNKVVIRCFGSCNLNVLYSTSFAMLGDATEDLRDLSGAMLETRFQFAELIVKCLWKVGRRLPTSLEQNAVEPAQLLADAEAFLQQIPPSEWRQRAKDEVPLGDLPLRAVKVILSHLVSAYGEDILSYLDRLEKPEEAEVYKLLLKMINNSYESEQPKDVPSEASDDERAIAPTGSETSERTQSQEQRKSGSNESEDAANTELKDIFERISQKEQSRHAIKDLYNFQKKFPHKQAHIERSLQSTGPIFQRYIKRALANHAAEDGNSAPAVASAVPAGVSAAAAVGSGAGEDESNGTSSPRSSHISVGKGIPMPATPERQVSSGSHLRQGSNADDRLAQLRAKFYNKTTGSPRGSTVSATSSSGGQAAAEQRDQSID